MDWHRRFLQQAVWTRDLRVYLFERAGLTRAQRVLEVGCGTGAILSDLSTPAAIHGLDLDPVRLDEAQTHVPAAALVCGNALALPYPSGAFDITFCHYLLLWVRDPLLALLEMKRVTRPGGSLLVLAEPDYDSRVDKPYPLARLGRWQAESLRRQGADPGLGSHLAGLFHQAGIRPIETGTMQGSPLSGISTKPRMRKVEVVLVPAMASRIRNVIQYAWGENTCPPQRKGTLNGRCWRKIWPVGSRRRKLPG